MEIKKAHSLRQLNTFGLEAKARQYVAFCKAAEILAFLSAGSLAGHKYLVLGGGSNLLFVEDFDGIILHPCLTGVEVLEQDAGSVLVKVMAGEPWDDFVHLAVTKGWAGVENLSLIPGNVGGSAVQNIGAYGVEAKDVIEGVAAIDLSTGEKATVPADQCGFAYRESHFKSRWKDRFVITAVHFRLQKEANFTLNYPGVADEVNALGAPNLIHLRQAIINIRQRKLPDPSDLGNAGSFFKNPVVADHVYDGLKSTHPDLLCYPVDKGRVKLPAGWLVEQCGWKAKTIGQAGVYQHQALVLVNYGGATGRQIYELSEQIISSVKERFGIDLEREVRVIT